MAHLDPAQLLTLKAAILAETDPTFVALRNTNNNGEMANWLNQQASPAFTVWKTSVSLNAIGDKINGNELEGLASLPMTRLQTIALFSPQGVNPSLADRRAFFDGVFSGAGGAGTRAALLVLWKRTARRIEKIFATGTGSDASPATMTVEGAIDGGHIGEAREAV
jgi:hypothetical protein